jgi:hypothetical protein
MAGRQPAPQGEPAMTHLKLPAHRALAAAVAVICVAAAGSAQAEVVTYVCKGYEDTCDSRWVIDSVASTVTWHWCDSPDTTEPRNVVMTADKITFDEEFMSRHYEFDRKTGKMTITAGDEGDRYEDGYSMCNPG